MGLFDKASDDSETREELLKVKANIYEIVDKVKEVQTAVGDLAATDDEFEGRLTDLISQLGDLIEFKGEMVTSTVRLSTSIEHLTAQINSAQVSIDNRIEGNTTVEGNVAGDVNQAGGDIHDG